MLVGYGRTSTAEQDAGLSAQVRDLEGIGCERVFSEQVSSVAERAKLAECLAFLRHGDTLVVTKPDRLARSTMELLEIEAGLTKRGVGLMVLSMGGTTLDTRNPTSKLMLTILAGVAAWEREIMLERQREGIAKAKADGKYKGRAPTARRQSDEVLRLRSEGVSPTEIARQLGMSRMSVYRIMGRFQGRGGLIGPVGECGSMSQRPHASLIVVLFPLLREVLGQHRAGRHSHPRRRGL